MQIFIYSQWEYFLISLIIGFVLGFLYDFICSLPKIVFNNKIFSFISDAAFILLWSFLFIIVSYSCNFGTYRFYSFLANFGAFLIYRITFGKLMLRCEVYIFKKILKFFNYIAYKFKNTIDIFIKFVKIKYRNKIVKKYSKSILSLAEVDFVRKEKYEQRFNSKKAQNKLLGKALYFNRIYSSPRHSCKNKRRD